MGILENWLGRPGLAWPTLNQVDELEPKLASDEPEPSVSQDLSGTGPGPGQPIYHATHDGLAQSLSLAIIGVLFKDMSQVI